MSRSTFEAMSLHDLWDLHERVQSILEEKVEHERQKVQRQLKELRRKFGGASSGTRQRRQYPKVEQKFRNPANPEHTWSGRGRQPHWVKTWIASGATLDDLLIDRAQSVQNDLTRTPATAMLPLLHVEAIG